MKKWNPNVKPPANICPESLCDNWMKPGGMIARGLFYSIEDAWDKLEIIEKAGCECPFGKCTRLHGDA
jgi:hypothetical protein